MTLYSDLRGFIKEYVTKFRWPNDRGYKLLISLNTSKFPTQFAQFMFFPQCVVVLISAQFQGLLYPVLCFFFFCLSLFEVCSFHFSFHWLLGLSIFSHIYCSLFSEFHVCSFIPVFTIGLFAFLWYMFRRLFFFFWEQTLCLLYVATRLEYFNPEFYLFQRSQFLCSLTFTALIYYTRNSICPRAWKEALFTFNYGSFI